MKRRKLSPESPDSEEEEWWEKTLCESVGSITQLTEKRTRSKKATRRTMIGFDLNPKHYKRGGKA